MRITWVNLYEDQFSNEHDFPKTTEPVKFLIVASTGRCGSHMLGHALHKTGCFGFPLEYVNGANLAEWKRRLGTTSLKDTIREIQQRRTSPNGVFSIKLHYPHLAQFGGFGSMLKYFPDAYFVHLSRGDVLKQAVSLSIAKQTGGWISGQEPTNENPVFSFEKINACLRETIFNDSSWRYTLAASGCKHIDIDFDTARNDLAGTVQTIGDFMQIEIDPRSIPETQVTRKQSGNLNKDWVEKFVSEFNTSEELLSVLNRGCMEKMINKLRSLLPK